MQRIHTLIDKLSQQKAQGASPAHLLFTVQLLQQELQQLQNSNETIGTKKVAVVLPFSTAFTTPELPVSMPVAEPVAAVEWPEEKEVYVLDMVAEDEPEEIVPVMPEPVQQSREYTLHKPFVQESLFEEPKPAMKEESRPT
ncbi:MAG TPA: hypothetical protein VFL47_13370 [Flavisolibacter sp.]|nr:hypothetical protein [Flavisolibacter sp.]